MKTYDLKIAFVLILNAALAILSLTNCSQDNVRKMVWSVSSLNKEQVDVSFDPSRSPQIEIIASAEGGECRLACPNYKHVSFRERNIRANVHMDFECQFHAEITEPGVITIKFDKMPKDNEEINTYFMIDGENGADINATVVKVTRKLQEKKLIPVSHSNMASINL